MRAIDGYIFRATIGAFAVIVISLTAFIWLTQALREIDLMTNQGQTALVFIEITGLLIPVLVLIIAPIAFLTAMTFTLNKFNADSEIVVVSAAGVSPWRLFVPFLASALVVSIIVAAMGVYVAPKSLRTLRAWAGQVRADLATSILQPGRFVTLERGITFHIDGRLANGQLTGIFIDDRRDPKERITVLAETGNVLKLVNGTVLGLGRGSLQRQAEGQPEPTFFAFDQYAFDLSRFTAGGGRMIGPRERYLWELINPEADDPSYKQRPGPFRAELHDRLTGPLYPLAFALIAYVFLGRPATTRQGRGAAIAMTIVCAATLRFIGFGCIIVAANNAAALFVLYGSLIATLVLSVVAISHGPANELPAVASKALSAIGRRLSPRPAPG